MKWLLSDYMVEKGVVKEFLKPNKWKIIFFIIISLTIFFFPFEQCASLDQMCVVGESCSGGDYVCHNMNFFEIFVVMLEFSSGFYAFVSVIITAFIFLIEYLAASLLYSGFTFVSKRKKK